MRAVGSKAKDSSVSLHSTVWPEIPPLPRLEGIFLESVLPVRAFAHLTAPSRISEQKLCDSFNAWVSGIQARELLTVGWVRSIETRPKLHIHAALVAADLLDCEYAAALWRQMIAPRCAEAARVEPFRRGLCGLGYVLKHLPESDKSGQFSKNIAAFALGKGKSRFRTNSAERRHQRRIRAQLAAVLRAAPFRRPLR